MKQTINLYLNLPKIEAPLFADKKVWSLFTVLLLILIFIYAGASFQYRYYQKKIITSEKLRTEKQAILEQAQTEAVKNNTAAMIQSIASLKELLFEKRQLIGQIPVELLSNLDELTAQLAVLEKINIPQIQLTTMSFANDGKTINFTGFANGNLAILYFIKKLKNDPAFKNTYFSVIDIGNATAESPFIPFTISSTPVDNNASTSPKTT